MRWRSSGRSSARDLSRRKRPRAAGPFAADGVGAQLADSSVSACDANASHIASGRTIQNRNGMTHLAFARHKFGREENAGDGTMVPVPLQRGAGINVQLPLELQFKDKRNLRFGKPAYSRTRNPWVSDRTAE